MLTCLETYQFTYKVAGRIFRANMQKGFDQLCQVERVGSVVELRPNENHNFFFNRTADRLQFLADLLNFTLALQMMEILCFFKFEEKLAKLL